MQCHLSNREQIIDDYLSGTLSEEQIDEFFQHIYECDICFEELEFRENVALAIKKGGKETSYANTLPFHKEKIYSLRTLIGAAAAMFLILFLYGAYQLSLPQYYELALLTRKEQKSLSIISRSNISKEADEFAKGAESLLSTRQTKFGIVPYFNQNAVDSAITHLKRAFEETGDSFSRNKYAFYIGKAYLMKEDRENSSHWLKIVLESDTETYQDEAKNLLHRLESNK